jgi:hypothetical protein
MHDTLGEQTNLKCLENRFRRSHESLAIILHTLEAPQRITTRRRSRKRRRPTRQKRSEPYSLLYSIHIVGFPENSRR